MLPDIVFCSLDSEVKFKKKNWFELAVSTLVSDISTLMWY